MMPVIATYNRENFTGFGAKTGEKRVEGFLTIGLNHQILRSMNFFLTGLAQKGKCHKS